MKIKSESIQGVDLTGKVLIIKDNILRKEVNTTGNRLHKAFGGFGCNPNAIGRAVFTKCLGDGEESRWDRSDFEGWISDEEAAAYMVKERVLG
jgi:hypothetical protein